MTAPAWAEDMTDIYLGGAGTFSALGGGQAGLNDESDDYIQGTDCKSKNAWTNAIKGLIHNNGASFTVPTTGAVMAWTKYDATASIEVKEPGGSPSNGGIMIVEGSGSGDYNRYNVGGSDTIIFNTWVPWVVDPNTATASDTVGTPSGTEQWVGVEANLPTTAGPTKGAPIKIDAIRYGRCTLEYTFGDLGNGYNTFADAEGTANSVTNRWGLIEPVPGTTNQFYVQGFHSFGVSGSLVDFRDSNKVINIRDTEFVAAGFNRFEVINASSNVDWDNITFNALGTQSPGTFVHTAGAWDCTSCQFVDVSTFTLLAASVFTDCTFRGTGIITAPGSDLRGSLVAAFEGTANTSPVVWDVATDPDGKLDDMSFEKGTADTHAIEFGATIPSEITLRGLDFTGYSASQDNNASAFHFKDTTGTITLNLVGCTSDVSLTTSYRTDGATIVVVEDPVTATARVVDVAGVAIEDANVHLEAAAGSGTLPVADTVTIVNSGTTATVTHTAHGLLTNDKVVIRGASLDANNGVYQVSVTNANTYTYTMGSSPGSSPTGTITSTYVLLNGLTSAAGEISTSRVFGVDQTVSGRSRKSSPGDNPLYKNTVMTGTVSSTANTTIGGVMIED